MHTNRLGVVLSRLLVSVTRASVSSTLFSGASNSLEVIRNGSVLVTDDRITSVYAGTSPPSPVSVPSDVEEVDVTNKIVTPGFVDTHHHGWQTAYKTIGSNASLVDYFNRFGEFLTAQFYPFDRDEVYYSQVAGLYEALNAGVTTTLDHAHHTFSNSTSGSKPPSTAAPASNYTIQEQFVNHRAIASNALYSGTPTTLGIVYGSFGPNPNTSIVSTILDLIRESNASVLTTHSVQGPFGITNSPEDFSALGLFDSLPPTTPLPHAQLLRQHNHTISITPESEMHYGHTNPTSHLIQDFASIGVDTHFTFSTDILTQTRLWLQSVRRLLYSQVLDRWEVPVNSPMSANQAFLLATRNGGLSLRREDLGVIAPGAKADLVIWDGASPDMLGWRDPVAAVILHANVGDVEGVLVDGKWKKRDRKIVDDKYGEVRERFLEVARWIQERVIAKGEGIGLPQEGERFQSGFEFGNTSVVDVVPHDEADDRYGGLFL
ncbi:putative hydrolase protein [Triangularia setosa]|uniref:Hydrolase protein n=1 Tax=Triangularia setosa TaxID=2587417 RepID=A0AAN6VZE3_9PEZI|nr:putative hydrolase protein [Podospora setosa]